MEYTFRKAVNADTGTIWNILQAAIQRRKEDGSNQWQDGYPNPEVVQNDIDKGQGFLLLAGTEPAGYCAIIINDEPAYQHIEGTWLTQGDYLVLHRIAIAEAYLGKGLAREILKQAEGLALAQNIKSIKADTNFDNPGMLHLFKKLGYQYCGEVHFRGSARKAFEKVLS